MERQPDPHIARHQAIRLRRFLMAPVTYAIFALAVAAIDTATPEDISPARWGVIIAVALCANVIFGWLIRSGRNLRFRDPSLTAPQIIASGYWGLLVLDALPSQRPLVLMYFLGGFAFGILQLNTRQYLGVAAWLVLGYAGMLVRDLTSGRAGLNPGHELLVMMLFGVMLVWFSFFGGFVSRLRRELKLRKAELENANQRIQRQATTDDLTDIANRRHALEALRHMKAIADRFSLPLSVALLDIDHFKSINDRFGHGTGDLALQEFAAWLREQLRDADRVLPLPSNEDDTASLVARYGGEEFLVLLPGADLESACLCAERLRSTCTVRAGPDALSFSVGVATYRAGESIEAMLARADRGLYGAKEGGRNRVCVAED